jgi:hypothetical protein
VAATTGNATASPATQGDLDARQRCAAGGYIICDLAILGLRQQGKTLDQSTFSEDLRSIGSFNPGGGLGCREFDISLAGYGKPAQEVCDDAVQVKNGKFVVLEPKGSKVPYWTGSTSRGLDPGPVKARRITGSPRWAPTASRPRQRARRRGSIACAEAREAAAGIEPASRVLQTLA